MGVDTWGSYTDAVIEVYMQVMGFRSPRRALTANPGYGVLSQAVWTEYTADMAPRDRKVLLYGLRVFHRELIDVTGADSGD